MADIRIKDLTTTASSTASDDFIAVDGTTNGTRKLNAFSPTFGGNATVTGTLTVNSTLTANGPASGITVNGAGITMDTDPVGSSASLRFVDGATSRFWIYKLSGDSNLYIRDMTNSRMQARFNPNTTSGTAITSFYSKVEIDATTASTTTSTGALVVSGGLGVGGAINAGGAITSNNGSGSGLLGMRSSSGNASYVFWSETGVSDRGILGFNNGSSTLSYRSGASSFSTGTEVFSISSAGNTTFAGTLTASNFIKSVNTSAANDTEFTALRADVGADGTLGAAVVAIGSLPSATGASRYGFITCSDNIDWRKLYIGGRPGLAPSGGQVLIPSTASSTSTSSGALVVSGGVGVAGNTNIGGVISVGGNTSSHVAFYVQNTALTGTEQYGVASEPIWTSSAQLGSSGWFRSKTAAASFTLTAARALFVESPTLGAGSSITSTYGIQIRNQGATGVTNAYGVYVDSQSGASSVNYAIYTAGGRINFQGLPTSSAGLPAGTLWNDGGTLKVA